MFKIKYRKEKLRLLLVGILLILGVFVSFKLLEASYATYKSSLKLNANIDHALYIFAGEKMSFNIDVGKIVPSNDTYKYKFSVSNFNETKQSDINLEYMIKIRSTTNLPITLKLYRGEDLTTNIISAIENKQDVDGAWYKVFKINDIYQMKYTERLTDIYTLEVVFPYSYAANTVYADGVENIEIILESKQIVS